MKNLWGILWSKPERSTKGGWECCESSLPGAVDFEVERPAFWFAQEMSPRKKENASREAASPAWWSTWALISFPLISIYTNCDLQYTFLLASAASKHDFGNPTLHLHFGFAAWPQELEDYEEKRQRYRLRVGASGLRQTSFQAICPDVLSISFHFHDIDLRSVEVMGNIRFIGQLLVKRTRLGSPNALGKGKPCLCPAIKRKSSKHGALIQTSP